MESVKPVTTQQAARAQEYYARLDQLHDELNLLAGTFYNMAVKPACGFAETVEKAAMAFSDPDDTPKGAARRQIAVARISLGEARQRMKLLDLSRAFDQVRDKLAELEAWEHVAPLLDSCSD
jgi:hypothetical protein